MYVRAEQEQQVDVTDLAEAVGGTILPPTGSVKLTEAFVLMCVRNVSCRLKLSAFVCCFSSSGSFCLNIIWHSCQRSL